MVKLPAGITTISGQSGQSRNTVPGTCPEVATVIALASAALFVSCPNAVPVKMSTANSRKIRICCDSARFEKNELRLASLLIAERNQRIDAYRAPRWNVAGE
jgi:hypothetical protein